MVDLFDTIYTNVGNKYPFLVRVKFYSLQRVIIRLLANVIIPIYYRFNKTKYFIEERQGGDRKYIVTLTSFPARIDRLWIVVESLLRQSYKPDKIILWLSSEQFESADKLPQALLNQQKRGLTIRFCADDLKSHKKYHYALIEFPDDFLITVDDDIIYPTTMIAQLVKLNEKYPKSICCHRALIIETKKGNIAPYTQWPTINHDIGPSFKLFYTSGGGTLFPPNSFHNEILNVDVFKKLCFYADDVWLNSMSHLNKTVTVKSDYNSDLLPILNFNNVTLYSINLSSGQNDIQLSAVREYYIKKWGIDAFKELFDN